MGYATPPAVVAVGVWSIVTLSGMQRPELGGLFAHVTGASVPVTLAPTRLGDEPTIDRAWFAGTTERLAAFDLRPTGDWVVQRAAYRGWLRFFVDTGGTLAAFGAQTTYPGGPPPNVGFISACSPVGTSDPIAGATRWIETADEIVPPEDTGYPPFLRMKLAPGAELPALRALHDQHVDRVCDGAPLLAIDEPALRTVFQADRQWWFDWCAQSLVGMMADCRPPQD